MTRGATRTFVIRPGDAATLGRSRRCTVQLRDPKVSRRHCQLSFAQGHVVAVDFDSRHGILHLGQRKAILAMAVGDGIYVGETFVRFAAIDEVDAATVAGWFAPGGIYAARPVDPSVGEDEDADEDDDGGDRVAGDPESAGVPTFAPAPPAAEPAMHPRESIADWRPDLAPAASASQPLAVPPSPPTPSSLPPPRQPTQPAAAPAEPASPVWQDHEASVEDYPEVQRPGEPLRLRPEPRRRPASVQKAFTARLAAEAIIFSIHMALCIALLLAMRAVFGFDLYRAAGFSPG